MVSQTSTSVFVLWFLPLVAAWVDVLALEDAWELVPRSWPSPVEGPWQDAALAPPAAAARAGALSRAAPGGPAGGPAGPKWWLVAPDPARDEVWDEVWDEACLARDG